MNEKAARRRTEESGYDRHFQVVLVEPIHSA